MLMAYYAPLPPDPTPLPLLPPSLASAVPTACSLSPSAPILRAMCCGRKIRRRAALLLQPTHLPAACTPQVHAPPPLSLRARAYASAPACPPRPRRRQVVLTWGSRLPAKPDKLKLRKRVSWPLLPIRFNLKASGCGGAGMAAAAAELPLRASSATPSQPPPR